MIRDLDYCPDENAMAEAFPGGTAGAFVKLVLPDAAQMKKFVAWEERRFSHRNQ